MYDLRQYVKNVTHKKGGLLDLIINESQNSCSVENVQVDQVFDHSDHYPILFSLPYQLKVKDKKENILVRDMNNFKLEDFCYDLQHSELCKPQHFSSLSADSTVQLYNSVLTSLFDKHCPLVQKTYKEKQSKSKWFNSDLAILKQNKRRAERRFKKHPSHKNYDFFRAVKNQYNWKTVQTREEYFGKKLNNSMKDKKSLYKTVNKLIGNSQQAVYPTFDSELNIANKMTNFFSDKINKIRKEIEDKISESNLIRQSDNLFTGTERLNKFSSINADKLLELIADMNSKTSSLDPVPTSVVKNCMNILAPVILHIVNQSIAESSFPDTLKHASVTPIIKNKDDNSQIFKNYHPVSNLPFLSKLLEKVAFREINSHLSINNLHGKFQSGYKKHHSCETAMFKMVGDIQNVTAKRNNVALLTLDLSSAFDALDHQILLERLKIHFGIDKEALTWLISYLKGRTFSVAIKGCRGKPMLLLFGVPQGSLLGPLLFIMYCKEIENIAHKYGLSVQLYADDSQLYVELTNSNLAYVKDCVESCLHEIQVWMSTNFMKINEDKTKFVIFTPSRNPSVTQDLNIVFDGEELEKISSTTILGSTLTPNLNFKSFIIAKCQSCNNHLRNIKQIKKSLNTELRFMLVNNLIMSQLDFCNSLLAACPQYLLYMLQRVVNDAVRFVFDLRSYDHITEHMAKLHIIPVKYRILYKLCLLAYRVVDQSAPLYMSEMFSCFQPTTNMTLRIGPGRDQKMLVYNGTDKLSDKCLFQILINTWNSLPVDIRSVNSIEKFKKHLKTFYFREAYHNV